MVEDKIKSALTDIQTDIVNNYDTKGLRASGKFEKSLEQFYSETPSGYNFGIKGANYSEFMENGRRPNQNQEPETLKKWVGWAGSTFLAQWVRDKGLSINPFTVAWKIARQGIKVPNTNNPGGVISEVLTKDRIEEFLQVIKFSEIERMRSDVRKILE